MKQKKRSLHECSEKVNPVVGAFIGFKDVRQFLFRETFQIDIRWVPDNAVEATALHDFREALLPIKDVYVVLGFFVEQEHLIIVVEVRAYERVTTCNVVSKVWKNALALADPVALLDLVRFAFDNLEQQGELGDFDGLRVDVDSKDVVKKDTFALVVGELPFAAGRFVNFRVLAVCVALDLALIRLIGFGMLNLTLFQPEYT